MFGFFQDLSLNRRLQTGVVILLVLAIGSGVNMMVTTQLQKRSANAVDLAGRQRMLSQRIAMLYLAMAWKLPDPRLRSDFDAAVSEFERGQAELQKAPQNTEEIRRQLEQIDTQWRFARAGFSLADDSRFVPTVIVTTSDSLLRKIEQLTLDYERLAGGAR